jgi:hypothetical protein
MAALLVLACAALAACDGGDDDGDGDGSRPLSRSEFVREADAICKRVGRTPFRVAQPPPEAARAADRRRREVARSYRRLRGLTPPAELKGAFDAYLAQTRKIIGLLGDAWRAARFSNAPAFDQALRGVQRAGMARDRFGKRIGFKVCGKPVSARK